MKVGRGISMVQVFAKKVWGLGIDKWPLLTFSSDGYRQSYLKRAEPDALVCLIATKGKNSKSEDKGRILGIVECGSALVNAESILLKVNGGKLEERTYENGKFKWPYGLSLERAWYFPDKPIAADVVGKLHFSSVRGCERLSDEAARRVLRLRRTEANPDIELFLPPPDLGNPSRKGGVAKPARGVPPAVSGYQVTRTKLTSFVYVLHFQETDIFKVGWAFDVEARAKDINQHIPSEVLPQQWEIFLWRRYDDQFQAYEAEQLLLRGPLKKYRTQGERVRIGERELRLIWDKFAGV